MIKVLWIRTLNGSFCDGRPSLGIDVDEDCVDDSEDSSYVIVM